MSKRILILLIGATCSFMVFQDIGFSKSNAGMADLSERTKPLVELGNKLLAPGKLSKGYVMPGGAVWQPALTVWGVYRSAFQAFDDGKDVVSEWANRFDLFGNVNLTPTERVLAGIRFLDDDEFTGYTFRSKDRELGSNNGFNFEIRTLFFEGDFGEMFPGLDLDDRYGLDFGISVGRQELVFQGGALIQDNVDALGISKINLKLPGVVNYRTTFLWAWNELDRANAALDESESNLFGWMNAFDFRNNTLEADIVYVDGDEDGGSGIYWGLSSTQRIKHLNTTFRVLNSIATDDKAQANTPGVLLTSEMSWMPRNTHDHFYVNGFVGLDHYQSATRGVDQSGALGGMGILFESAGLGLFPSALDSSADEVIGGTLGYQLFQKHERMQWIFELGGRYALSDEGQRAVGPGLRFQYALNKRTYIQLNGFSIYAPERDLGRIQDTNLISGGRIELKTKF